MAMEASDPARTTCIALAFEGGLGAAAIGVGWLVGQWPFVGMTTNEASSATQVTAIGWGLAATGPLLFALFAIDHLPLPPLRQLREMAERIVKAMFGGASLLQLAMVSIAAGFGEELLFRGLLQAGLARWISGPAGPWLGLAAASVLFGICHWLNTTYALLAMLAGAYFGLLLAGTGSLWTPIVGHATYDFIALIYLLRPQRLIR